jgi:hypothetical protein
MLLRFNLMPSCFGMVLAGVALFGTACKEERSPEKGNGNNWFNSAVIQLPKGGPVSAAPAEWRAVRTPDGLVFRLSPEYHPRNDYGCWDKQWPGPGWRDVCVGHGESLRERSGFRLKPGPRDPKMEDQHEFDSWRAETVTFGERRAIVERARSSGGIEGARRQRVISILVELGHGDWASLSGRVGDDPGYDELLTVAGTIDPAGPWSSDSGSPPNQGLQRTGLPPRR